MTDKELFALALGELLDYCEALGDSAERNPVVAALRDRLARQEQEPVGSFLFSGGVWGQVGKEYENDPDVVKLYTAPPPAREWVGLTDEEVLQIRFDWLDYEDRARAIEAKLKERNA